MSLVVALKRARLAIRYREIVVGFATRAVESSGFAVHPVRVGSGKSTAYRRSMGMTTGGRSPT